MPEDLHRPGQWAVEEVKEDEGRPNGRWVFLAPAGSYQPDQWQPEPGQTLVAVEPGRTPPNEKEQPMSATQVLAMKVRRAKKAVVGTLVQLTALVVAFAPGYADEYKLGVWAIGTVFTGFLVYLTTNEE